MSWAQAIDRNRAALLAVVVAIVALIGGREGGPVARRLRIAALALLRPAEFALRRLIIAAARGVSVTLRSRQKPAFDRASIVRRADSARPPAFPLFDRLKRFDRAQPRAKIRFQPRIRVFWGAPQPPVETPPAALASGLSKGARTGPDALVDIGRLRRRLRSFEAALADLPRQALRFARWRARFKAQGQPRWPLRPGPPPGHRLRESDEVDRVLLNCHALARDALAADTS